MRFKIGVDIGGTFTDTTVLREDGSIVICKTPSTPDAPERGVLEGIVTAMQRAGAAAADCVALVNSSTVAVNSVVQRNGATVGLLVTRGFEDLMEMGRVKMTDPFSLAATRRPPLVPKSLVRGVHERIGATGVIVKRMDEASLLEAAGELIGRGAETLAVLFLHSYKNAAHEQAAKKLLAKRFPGMEVSTSSEVWPQVREYERGTVLVMNSYIAPKMKRYIRSLDEHKATAGLECPLFISGSNGGVMPASQAMSRPITTLLSGPSAGTVAAVHLMRTSGIDRSITLDVGGTSADICVLSRGDIPYSWGQEIEGLPIAVPYVDVSSIGAGGGSLAYADNMGMLKVGPDSAGAVPGPAAYDRGGTRPTLTDAYLVSGFIDPDNFVGGEIKLSVERARAAIAPLAERLGLDLDTTAAGIMRVTTSNLVAEFTRLTAKNGIDPREYTLMPFGGAGPTHACFLADELHIRRVAIPVSPGTFCALGSVLADFRLDFLKTAYSPITDLSQSEVERWYEKVTADGHATLREVMPQIAALRVIRTADVRYLGQGFEVAIAFEQLAEIPALFSVEYQKRYGPRQDDAPVEVINLRATLVGEIQKPPLSWSRHDHEPATEHVRSVHTSRGWKKYPVYRRETFFPGWKAAGPFLVDQPDTTCVVTEGWQAEVDDFGTLRLQKDH